MESFRLPRTVLCIYELLRLVFLIGAFLALQPEGNMVFPWLAVITPGAMYLLMALFWRLNMPRYQLYCPLYLAGKGLGVATTLFWLFFANSGTILKLSIDGRVLSVLAGIVIFLLLGDTLSAWLVTKMMKI